jgi:hypothetical protein
MKELFDEYLNKRLRIRYKKRLGSQNRFEIKRNENETYEKVQELIKRVESKEITARSNQNFQSVFVKNSHNIALNTVSTLSYERACVSTSKERKNNFPATITKETIRSQTTCYKLKDDSIIEDDSFTLNQKPKSSNPLKIELRRRKILNINEITQIENTIPDEKSKSKNNIKPPVKSLKLKIVTSKVKNNLIEWKETKSSNKFHSGNFDLPLFTLSSK